MRKLQAAFDRLYRGMLACYPTRTRREFGEEMLQVFHQQSDNRADRGAAALFRLILRELWDWPIAVMHAYRDQYLQGSSQRLDYASPLSGFRLLENEVEMKTIDEFGAQEGRKSLWMSLPPLLLGLGVMIGAFIRTDVWYRLPSWQLNLSIGIMLFSGVIVSGVGLVALFRRIPDWGLTWLGSAFMGFVLTLQVFLEELIDEGMLTLEPILEVGLGLGLFLTGLALLLIIAARGWSRSGLFTLAAAATMGLSLLQSVTAAPINRDDLALLAGPLGLIFALLIYFYCQKPGAIRWFALVLTGLINVGAVLVMANAWSGWRLSPEANSFVPPLLVLITGLLLSGPISGLLIKPVLRRWT
jgi:hypothetical protein